MCVCVTCAGKMSDNEQIIFIFTFTIKRPSKCYDLLESDKKRQSYTHLKTKSAKSVLIKS